MAKLVVFLFSRLYAGLKSANVGWSYIVIVQTYLRETFPKHVRTINLRGEITWKYHLSVEIYFLKWFYYTYLVRLWASSTSCSDLRPQFWPNVETIITEANIGQKLCCNTSDTLVKDKLIHQVICPATALDYPEATHKTLSERVICPQVSGENKNRVSLTIDPWGHHVQSSRTNKHQRRQRNMLNRTVSNPFPQSMN